MKLCITGMGRHGKDTACEFFHTIFGLRWCSSSEFVGRKAVWPVIGHLYDDFDKCYADRYNKRAEWFQLIRAYNGDDLARLSRELMADYDIYCGLRNVDELRAGRYLFDCVIWVDASKRLEYREPNDSLTITQADCDYVLDNNGTIDELAYNVRSLHAKIMGGAIDVRTHR